jgi:hypothetical protein
MGGRVTGETFPHLRSACLRARITASMRVRLLAVILAWGLGDSGLGRWRRIAFVRSRIRKSSS